MAALRLYELLLPAAAKESLHRAWERQVAGWIGGLSLPPGQIKGRWKGSEATKIAKEAQIPVRIACNRSDLRRILAFTATHYRQEEVLAYQVSAEAILFKASHSH